MHRTVVDHIVAGMRSGRPEVITAAMQLTDALDDAGLSIRDEVDQALADPRIAWRPPAAHLYYPAPNGALR
jgi:hypothetical protein